MSELVFEVPIDPARAKDDAAAEQTLVEIGGRLMPVLLATRVGAVEYRHGDRAGTEWSTEWWLADKTFLRLSVEVGASRLSLLVDTCYPLKPPAPPASRAYLIGLTMWLAAASVAAGLRYGTVWPVVGAFVGALALWMTVEFLVDVREERAARRRVIDEVAWRRRLDAAIG